MIGDPLSPPSVEPRSAPEAFAAQANASDVSWLRWGPAIAGGLIATAASLILTGFGRTLGFSDVTETWRHVTPGLAILAGVWALVVAIAAASLGGYLAGRTRDRWNLQPSDEVSFRDGAHGLIAWAIAVILTGLIASYVSSSQRVGGGGDPYIPTSADALGAPVSILTRQTDRLLEAPSRANLADPNLRMAVGRLLTSAAAAQTVNAGDRAELIRLVGAADSLSASDAQRRVDGAIATARDEIRSAHRAKDIGGFIVAASLVAAAAAAWFAAEAGGRHREGPAAPSLHWSPRRVRVVVR